jgi:hypothetical protein
MHRNCPDWHRERAYAVQFRIGARLSQTRHVGARVGQLRLPSHPGVGEICFCLLFTAASTVVAASEGGSCSQMRKTSQPS